MKTCNKCHQEQQLSNFIKDKRCLDGYRNCCKTCSFVDRREYYKQYRDKKRAERIASGWVPKPPKPKKPKAQKQARGSRIVDLAMQIERQKRLRFIMERWFYVKNRQEAQVRQSSTSPYNAIFRAEAGTNDINII